MSALLKNILSSLRSEFTLPILLISLYFIVIILVRRSMPTAEEIVESLSYLYERHGYQIIFVASILEALVLVNLFVPGTLAVAMGVVFAKNGGLELDLVILTALLGVMISYMIDYFLGYFGFSRFFKALGYEELIEHSQKKVSQFGTSALIVGFIYSNVGAFISIASGILRINIWQFTLVAAIASLFWLSIWGLLIYVLGDIVLNIITRYSSIIIAMVVLGLILSKIWGRTVKVKNP